MKINKLVQPVLKWVGGKRQILPAIVENMPKRYNRYYEPCLGGGAVLFHLQPRAAFANDTNEELINVYTTIRDDVEGLIECLEKHRNDSEYYYLIRDIDRDRDKYCELSNIEKASRIIFLNKTCYNGLFRVNNSGEFNSPFGKYSNPNIVNSIALRAMARYLNESEVELTCGDFEQAVCNAKRGDFVYFDPPYDPVSSSANFTGYAKGGFNRDDQERLWGVCENLTKRGVHFLLSNSSTSFIKELYSGYKIINVPASRRINSKADERGHVQEVLIKNYE